MKVVKIVSPATNFCYRLSRPHGHNAAEGLCQRKIPMTQSGIEPATFQLVTQYINQLRHSVPVPVISPGEEGGKGGRCVGLTLPSSCARLSINYRSPRVITGQLIMLTAQLLYAFVALTGTSARIPTISFWMTPRLMALERNAKQVACEMNVNPSATDRYKMYSGLEFSNISR
jgi:hypothetical protein